MKGFEGVAFALTAILPLMLGYRWAPRCRVSMRLTMKWCPCGGKRVAPATNLCPHITLGECLVLGTHHG